MMYDKPDIRLVNSHAECNRGNNHLELSGLPPLLDVDPLLGWHTGVVVLRLDVELSAQFFCHFFTIRAREAIHHACLSPVRSLDDVCNAPENFSIFAFGPHLVREIGSVETLDEYLSTSHTKVVHHIDFDI